MKWIYQLETALRAASSRLAESERQRQADDEAAAASRRSYEAEMAWLNTQLSTAEQDLRSERRAREATAVTLEQVRAELSAAQRQVSALQPPTLPWASAHRGEWGQLTPLEKWMKN